MKPTLITAAALALFCTAGGVLAYQKVSDHGRTEVTKYPFIDRSLKYRPEQTLPDHTFATAKGAVKLADLLGQHERNLIMVADYNCVPCVEELKGLHDIPGINDMNLIVISKDPLAFQSKYAAVMKLKFTYLHDKNETYAHKTLGSEATPQTILTDQKAEILFLQSGRLINSHGDNRLHDELPDLFGGAAGSGAQKENL
ncbi:peroxiredoxin family protein [Deinococcus depolymerans]|uniref:Alkyl hydroperoxide reductase subunit C/ Thiol specific antioxidant domain-containing protein n=1 Tax=Deinococcus depolymerans TaxID=392408 RepID=A0ABN1BMC7_9DEIO